MISENFFKSFPKLISLDLKDCGYYNLDEITNNLRTLNFHEMNP